MSEAAFAPGSPNQTDARFTPNANEGPRRRLASDSRKIAIEPNNRASMAGR